MKIALHGSKPTRDTMIPYGKQYIDNDDIKSVEETLLSPYITSGPKVEEFENRLCDITGARYAVAIANGTAALHAACCAVGIKPGDEVITTPMTFVASANCILYFGATPIFADINPCTWTIDPIEIRKNITNKTKAIIAVDYTGQATQIDQIREICREYNLVLIVCENIGI